MRLEILNRIVGEAVTNGEFRGRLLSDPRAAVAGYDLAAEEVELLANLHAESVDQFARHLVSAFKLDAQPLGQVVARTAAGFPARGGSSLRGQVDGASKVAAPVVRAYMSPEL